MTFHLFTIENKSNHLPLFLNMKMRSTFSPSRLPLLLHGRCEAVDLSLDGVDLLRYLSQKTAAFQQHALVLLQDAVDFAAWSHFKILKGFCFGSSRTGKRQYTVLKH